MMTKSTLLSALVGALFVIGLAIAPAHAQATRTWISGVGDDGNPCSRTAPCKTFAGAISKTASGGEINCLDPGGFGGVTLVKPVTLNCKYTIGSVLVAGAPGITINTTGATDKVTLRGIQIQGINQTATPGTIGVRILAANSVSIEDCVITGFGQQAVLDSRTAGNTNLSIKDTYITNNTGAGVAAFSTALSFTVLQNVHLLNNLFGVNIATNNNVVIKRSVIVGSADSGVQTNPGSQAQIDDSVISSNLKGLNSSIGGTIKVSNSDFVANPTTFIGTITSFGNNRITGPIGTAPTAAGAASTDFGQQ
jgi:hypothetical protein